MEPKATFTKSEHLKDKILIDKLFTQGERKRFGCITFYNYFIDNDTSFDSAIVVVARKRNFKKAVDRNRIKRLLRECYRKNKFILDERYKLEKKRLLLGAVYAFDKLPTYSMCNTAFVKFFLFFNSKADHRNEQIVT